MWDIFEYMYSVVTVVKWIHRGGCWKNKMMTFSPDFKLEVLQKFTKTAKEFNAHWKCSHLRAQGDSLKGACAAKCSKFNFEKFENSIIPLKGACAPMRGNRVNGLSGGNEHFCVVTKWS